MTQELRRVNNTLALNEDDYKSAAPKDLRSAKMRGLIPANNCLREHARSILANNLKRDDATDLKQLIATLPDMLRKAANQGLDTAQIMHVAFASPTLPQESPPKLSANHRKVVAALCSLRVRAVIEKGVYYSNENTPSHYAWMIKACWKSCENDELSKLTAKGKRLRYKNSSCTTTNSF